MTLLLQRVAAGEQAAFKLCLEQYGNLIWGLARKFSPTAADAEDATQDIFVQLWKNARQYDPARGSEGIFIATLTRRLLISRFRSARMQRQQISVEDLDAAQWEPSRLDDSPDHLAARRAAQALGTLSADQQRVIKLAVVRGLSQSEIAAHTGLPLGTVKTLMRRGLMVMRERLSVTPARVLEEGA